MAPVELADFKHVIANQRAMNLHFFEFSAVKSFWLPPTQPPPPAPLRRLLLELRSLRNCN
jgi:hypothetical protein